MPAQDVERLVGASRPVEAVPPRKARVHPGGVLRPESWTVADCDPCSDLLLVPNRHVRVATLVYWACFVWPYSPILEIARERGVDAVVGIVDRSVGLEAGTGRGLEGEEPFVRSPRDPVVESIRPAPRHGTGETRGRESQREQGSDEQGRGDRSSEPVRPYPTTALRHLTGTSRRKHRGARR